MGGVVTDTNCQRASQSLYETIAVSLFARLPPRALLAANHRSRVTRVRLLFPRGFSSKRETARSLRLSGLFDYPDFFLWSQFFHEYELVVILKTQSRKKPSNPFKRLLKQRIILCAFQKRYSDAFS